jgi:hypothetical protein
MKPVPFPGQNIVFGETQPEYKPLPALLLPGKEGEVITCWELTDEDLEQISKTKKIYLAQFTFGHRLQPITLLADLSDNITLI